MFVILALGLVVAPLAMAGRPDVATGTVVAQSTRLGPFEPLKPETEEVYIQQSLRAIYLLGWNRGPEWDSHFDWLMGREFTFRPWDHNGWRDFWAMSPGQRFARWWTGYCVAEGMNCDNCAGSGCDALKAQLATDFDIALSARVER